MTSTRIPWLPLAAIATLALLALSGWAPYDRGTWLLEVFPVMVALPLLCLTYRRYPLTPLLYGCLFLLAGVLMLGGAYSYARVPLGFALQDFFQLRRNPYDKIAHVILGFVLAVAARERLLRGQYLRGRRMLPLLVVCVVLAISACYEFVEWGAAFVLGQGAYDFLGTQGDPWDTQSDMFFALIGAVTALTCCARLHDRQLAALASPSMPSPFRHRP